MTKKYSFVKKLKEKKKFLEKKMRMIHRSKNEKKKKNFIHFKKKKKKKMSTLPKDDILPDPFQKLTISFIGDKIYSLRKS